MWIFHKTIPLLSWFKENKRKVNLDQYHLFISGTENVKIKLDDFTIQIQKRKNYLTFVDDRLKFPYIMENMCQKVSLKLSGLSCLAPICRSIQKKILFNQFFQSQFGYWLGYAIAEYPITKLNRLHKRCLMLIYNDKHWIFPFCFYS